MCFCARTLSRDARAGWFLPEGWEAANTDSGGSSGMRREETVEPAARAGLGGLPVAVATVQALRRRACRAVVPARLRTGAALYFRLVNLA